jgi:hypothetical protein
LTRIHHLAQKPKKSVTVDEYVQAEVIMTPVKAMSRQNNNDTIRQTRTELLSPKSSVEEGE